MCIFIKLGSNVNHDERMNHNEFGGQRSKLKANVGMCGDATIYFALVSFFCPLNSNTYNVIHACILYPKRSRSDEIKSNKVQCLFVKHTYSSSKSANISKI